MPQNFEKIRKVKDDNLKTLFKKPNVNGVGIGYKIENNRVTKELCIRIYVEEKKNKSQLREKEIIPERIGDFKTDVIAVGRIRFQACDQKTRKRPFYGGDSGGSCHSIAYGYIMAGTMGCKVVDKSDGKYCVLSNNHVFADMDNDGQTRAHAGDTIIQPGSLDGGTCAGGADTIGTLKRWIPFLVHGDNRVDAAIAELTNSGDMSSSIGCDVGHVAGIRTLEADDTDVLQVQKCGRTTCHTTGTVTDIDAAVNVSYEVLTPTGIVVQTFHFVHQILTTSMSSAGDSGSLIMDMDRKAVGLLFAGSAVITITNPIQQVLDDLNIEFPVSIIPCTSGGPFHCMPGGPDSWIHCRIGGPDRGLHCIIGGPDREIHCRIGGPDSHVLCRPGGPDTPPWHLCTSGGPFIIRCLACGPDSPMTCGSGGPDNLVDILQCAAGPGLDFRFKIPFEDPSRFVILDVSTLPQAQKKAFMKLLEEIGKVR
ncbi:MAG: hypothetical protein KBB71_13320 [Lentimicrobiaceae bacterium]|nr:hypothetical protein [Lentimicrobiaceae bacterium]